MRRRVARVCVLSVVAVTALTGAGCTDSSSTATTTTVPQLTGAMTVSAASSLTGAFTQLAASFHRVHPQTTVTFNFGSSGALATQIVAGAPADVFASASPTNMATVQAAHLVAGTPQTFARNRLAIVVKPGDPLGIHSLADLDKAAVIALCVPTAPCGATADEALAKAGVVPEPSKVSRGADVQATLTQVTTGDADAAVVYVTNAATVGSSGVVVPIPPAQNVTTSYPIGVLTTSADHAFAAAWVAYVLGPVGRATLVRAGFLPPG